MAPNHPNHEWTRINTNHEIVESLVTVTRHFLFTPAVSALTPPVFLHCFE